MPASDDLASTARRILSDAAERIARHWKWPRSSGNNDAAESNNHNSKAATRVVLLRAVANATQFVSALLVNNSVSWAMLTVADQLVVMWAVSFVAEQKGERRVCGVEVGERFFEIFLDIYVILHALFLVFFVGLVVSIAWFFGYTGAYPLLALGLILLPVAWLASQGEADGEGSLVLP
ncbi:hypothetical protein VTJ04DRAFT_3986 [Mycothermus thermophilus]|uniref:uncharacterized protein n=1 Tax=Humicola insolens TaxID=85995 RepID=UPI0037437671